MDIFPVSPPLLDTFIGDVVLKVDILADKLPIFGFAVIELFLQFPGFGCSAVLELFNLANLSEEVSSLADDPNKLLDEHVEIFYIAVFETLADFLYLLDGIFYHMLIIGYVFYALFSLSAALFQAFRHYLELTLQSVNLPIFLYNLFLMGFLSCSLLSMIPFLFLSIWRRIGTPRLQFLSVCYIEIPHPRITTNWRLFCMFVGRLYITNCLLQIVLDLICLLVGIWYFQVSFVHKPIYCFFVVRAFLFELLYFDWNLVERLIGGFIMATKQFFSLTHRSYFPPTACIGSQVVHKCCNFLPQLQILWIEASIFLF